MHRTDRRLWRSIPWLATVALVSTMVISVGTRSAQISESGFTDDPLVVGATPVRAAHITELRSRIDRLRVLRRLAAYSWVDQTLSSGQLIRASHIGELREALAGAYVAVGRQAPSYTLPAPHSGESIRAVHIAELRSAVLTLEGTEPLCKICSTPEPVLPHGFKTNAAGLFDCKWRDRTSLSVTFLDGDPLVQAKVRAVAQQWVPHIGMTLDFVPLRPDADIRISFKQAGRSWSNYGGPCRAPVGQPTMNYGWLFPDTPDVEYQRVVLHEFGHAFGLIHEHQSPAADIPWDVQKVYEHCRTVLNWDDAVCFANFLNRPSRTNFTHFDPSSVMLYPVDNSLTIGDFETRFNDGLSFVDKTFITTWYTNGPWTKWPDPEHQYLVGNWDAGEWQALTHRGDKLAVRRNNYVLMSLNYDGEHDFIQGFGNGNSESEYLVGDWNGDGRDNLAVRRANCVVMDVDFDGVADLTQCYGGGNAEDQYLVGDWDGDGRDNLAVRRGNCVLMDTNFDGTSDIQQCYGLGVQESEYLVGDWNGDGRDNLAVRRNNCVLMDTNFDGAADIQQCFGLGQQESEYLVGDWDGNGSDNLGVRRFNRVLMDFNFDGVADREQVYGMGR